jgi:hypothetical protein
MKLYKKINLKPLKDFETTCKVECLVNMFVEVYFLTYVS